jgi:hypothetical protein
MWQAQSGVNNPATYTALKTKTFGMQPKCDNFASRHHPTAMMTVKRENETGKGKPYPFRYCLPEL